MPLSHSFTSFSGSIIKAAKVRPSVFKEEVRSRTATPSTVKETSLEEESKIASLKYFDTGKKTEETDFKDHLVPSTQTTSEKKQEVIAFVMSPSYLNIMRRLDTNSRPLLGFLKEKRIISKEHRFFNLKPDITRFLVRQQEKRHGNSAIISHGKCSLFFCAIRCSQFWSPCIVFLRVLQMPCMLHLCQWA